MHNLSDRDMAYDVLYGCKAAATGYMAAVIESATPRCRELMHRLLDEALRDQWQVWQFLHQREEYRVQEAPRQEIEGVRRRMEHLAQTHRGQAATTPAGRVPARSAYEAERGRYNREDEWTTRAGAAEGWTTDARQHNGTAMNEAGAWDERDGGYGDAAASTTSGYAASADIGGYAGESGRVSFEPDRNMPDGTRFDAERGFAGAGTFEGSTRGPATGGRAPAARAETGTDGTRGRYETAGRGSPVGIGARPAPGSRRNFGENTWTSEATRRSQPAATQRY